jgi:hypothetical protein
MRRSRDGPRNVELIKRKLQDAVTLAKTTLKPPPDIITINGGPNTVYVTVEEVKIGDGLETNRWLYIFGSGQDRKREILFKAPKEKFRTIVFVGLADSRIFIMEKILKLTFLYCSTCQISIRGGSVGPVEFIKCVSTNIDIRGDATLPIVQVDMSNNVHFYQRSPEIVYAVCGCTNITGVIVDPGSGERIKQTPMQTSMFGEQTFLLFSKTEGIVQIQERYALNNIVQHLMFHEEENVDSEDEDSEGSAAKYKTLAFSPN